MNNVKKIVPFMRSFVGVGKSCFKPKQSFQVQALRLYTDSDSEKENGEKMYSEKEISFSVEYTYAGVTTKTKPILCKEGVVLRDVLLNFSSKLDCFGVCDGTSECSTCYIDLDQKDFDKLPPADEKEQDTLDSIPGIPETARLSCALMTSPELDGMTVKLPPYRADARVLDDRFDDYDN